MSQETYPRILGLVEGDPRAQLTLSGVPRYLLDALERRFPVVDRIDYGLRGARRAAQAVATFRPRRSDWIARFHLTPSSYYTLTRTLAERLRTVGRPFDVAFQVHGWVGGQPRPYLLYVDQTRAQIEAGWPQWLPMGARALSDARRLERSMYADAEHIFTMGEPARASLVADYNIAPERITITGGGLNFAALPPLRSEPAREPSVLFLGREFERKGGSVLLAAFRQVRERVPAATLHIVGPRRRFLQPGVVAHGMLADRQQISALFMRARVTCAPSLYEPWGFVCAEAMAHGVPCIGTMVQSMPYILDDGRAGMLVPPGDADTLAEAIITLLEDDALATRLARAGRRRVEQCFTWDHVVATMAPALASVGQNRAARA